MRDGRDQLVARPEGVDEGRSLRDLANIAHEIEALGANLRVLEQSVDTATSVGRAFFGSPFLLSSGLTSGASVKPGVSQDKKGWVYTGAKPRIDRDQVLALIDAGIGPGAAARLLGISRMTIYLILGEHTKEPDRAMGRRKSAGR